MPLTPICEVRINAGSWVATTGGVNAVGGDTVSIRLADSSSVVDWYLQVTGTDETSTDPILTNVDSGTHKVTTPPSIPTFTLPAGTGKSFLLQSTVTGVGGPILTTFSVYILTASSERVGSVGEAREGDQNFGWIQKVNPNLRRGAVMLWGRPIDPNLPTTGYVLGFDGTKWIGITNGGFVAGGDLTGTLTSQTVNKIQGVAISGSAVAGYVLTASSPTAATWVAIPAGFIAGGDLTGTPTSQTVSAIQGVVVTGAAAAGKVLTASSPTAATWATPAAGFTAGGDLTGTPTSQTVAKINGTTITTAGGALTTGYVLMVTGAGTADWSVTPWITGVTVQSGGTPITGNPHTTFNFTGAGVTTTDVAGVATVNIPGGGVSGDNSDAYRMGPNRPFLADNQSLTLVTRIRTTGLTDGATTKAGSDLVVSERRLLYNGTTGGVEGKLYSTELAGLQTGLDFDYTAYLAVAPTCSSALIGVAVPVNFFNTFAVMKTGAVSNYVYETIHSTTGDISNLIFDAGAEDWSGARAAFVYTNLLSGIYGAHVEIFWTTPLADKLYQANYFNDTGDPHAYSFPAEGPTAICAAGDNSIWVSFVTTGKIRHYTVVTPGGTYPTLSQVGGDITLAAVVDLLFDGKYLWALATTGVHGTLYKLNSSGTLIDTYTLENGTTTSASRMCFDGTRIWVTLDGFLVVFHPEGLVAPLFYLSVADGHARGIVTDHQTGAVYIAVYNLGLYIYAWYPPTGAPPETRRRTAVWKTGAFSMPTSFVAVDVPLQLGNSAVTFEFKVTANASGVVTHGSSWWKSVTVTQSVGATAIVGSVSDVVTPQLSASAIAAGFDVTVASTGTNLQVTITQGSYGFGVDWTIEIIETHTYKGSL